MTFFADFTEQFHFLRPWWFLLYIPLASILFLMWRRASNSSDWQSLIAPEFLSYLLEKKTNTSQSSTLWWIGIIWILATMALAGPSWHKRPSTVEKNQHALVILLDLSPSMMSQDLRPTRLARAKLKITDLLRESSDGFTALAVYGGDAHLVTPLSDDQNTLLNLLPSLDPQIMPAQGSNTEAAIQLAINLLKNAGATQGNILLITDGVVADAFSDITSQMNASNYSLTIWGIGSATPSPITNPKGGFVRDEQGSIITTQLNSALLQSLAQQVQGHYLEITTDNSDVLSLADQFNRPSVKSLSSSNTNAMQRDFDEWKDEGVWLVFLLLPLVLYCFRRGFLSIVWIGNVFFISALSFTSPSADASSIFDSAFKTKNQQAQRDFASGKHAEAAQAFENPEWRAAAKYKAGQFEEAAKEYENIDTANADYNRGNSLAKAGKLEEAIKAYDKALSRDANLSDAKKNSDIVKSLLDQQKQNNDKQNDQQKNDKQQNSQNQKNEQNKQDQSNKQEQANKSESGQQNSSDSKNDGKNQQQNASQQNAQAKNASSANSRDAQDHAQGQSSSAMNDSAQQANQSQTASAKQSSSQPMTQAQNATTVKSKKDEKDKPKLLDPYEAKMTPEEREAMQQWLRQVPDDPGGLLREKFKWQAIRNRENNSQSDDNKSNDQQRW